jgi:ribosomal-protein-alanine N-acetyltransferase
MAQIHAAAFVNERSWQAAEFADLLAKPHIQCLTEAGGFALIQTIADEAELLTLAVSPAHQRQGIAQQLMTRWISKSVASTAFLEVAADNRAAIALYSKNGFTRSGLRKGYYKRPLGMPVDALLMTRAFTQG